MPLSDLKAQPRALAALRAALGGGRVQHAYLFSGPAGAGKEEAARLFAQALTCPVQPGEGCGKCSSCGRVERGNHPDVPWLMSEDAQVRRGLAGRTDFGRTPSRDLRVEQVRSLQQRLVRRPLEAPRTVALVLEAEALNPTAQNAFLKTLEEPPSDAVLILVTASPDVLLPTVRSRLSRVPFGPPSVSATDDPEAAEARAEVARAFEALSGKDVRPLLRFAEAHGGSREEAETALRLLLDWNTGLARGGTSPIEPARLQRQHALFTQTLEVISERNGAPRLHLEGMLLEIFT